MKNKLKRLKLIHVDKSLLLIYNYMFAYFF